MEIVFIITGLEIGGAETQVCSIANKLYELGHKVTIIYLTGETEVNPKYDDIRLIGLNMKKTPLGLFRALKRCRDILIRLNPDVLHSHMIHANIFARLLRISIPVPVLISTAHSSNEGGLLRMLAYRTTNSLADLSTNVSTEALQSFITKKAMSSKHSTVVYNGIDIDKFVYNEASRDITRRKLNLDNDDFLFLGVGRITDAKDYPNLLKAFAVIHAKNRNTKLAIVGQGELEETIKAIRNKLSLQDSVYFLGARNDVNELMSACDCFVLASKYEGFGLVVAEAMATQRVVIGTDCGGVKEVIGNEGILIETENHIALADAMQKVIDLNYEQRKLIGIKARKRITNNYSLDATVSKWLELYKDPNRV